MAIKAIDPNWFAFLVVVIVMVYRIVHPIIQLKIKTIHNIHLQQALKITDQLATFIVPELATMGNMSKADRKSEAIRFVANKLSTQGITVGKDTISAAVEEAYQLYKHIMTSEQTPAAKENPSNTLEL